MNDNQKTPTEIDYKKLLRKCLESWYECEGVMWNPGGEEDLTNEEKEEVLTIERKIRQIQDG